LKTTLKPEIDEEARAILRTDTSRPFEKPKSGRIAVKVISDLGGEVMKVFRVGKRINMTFRTADISSDILSRPSGAEQKAMKTNVFDDCRKSAPSGRSRSDSQGDSNRLAEPRNDSQNTPICGNHKALAALPGSVMRLPHAHTRSAADYKFGAKHRRRYI
jgi:hypothetical protein